MTIETKNKLIKIAYENPELRDSLLPIIHKEAGSFGRGLALVTLGVLLGGWLSQRLPKGTPEKVKDQIATKLKAEGVHLDAPATPENIKAATEPFEEVVRKALQNVKLPDGSTYSAKSVGVDNEHFQMKNIPTYDLVRQG
jgi:hypothetical protein